MTKDIYKRQTYATNWLHGKSNNSRNREFNLIFLFIVKNGEKN